MAERLLVEWTMRYWRGHNRSGESIEGGKVMKGMTELARGFSDRGKRNEPRSHKINLPNSNHRRTRDPFVM